MEFVSIHSFIPSFIHRRGSGSGSGSDRSEDRPLSPLSVSGISSIPILATGPINGKDPLT